MMTLSRLQRTLDAGQYRTLLNSISENGRPMPAHLLDRLQEPNVVRAAAEAMALLRASELVYARDGADLGRLVSAVLERQSDRTGAFRDDAHPRTDEVDRSICTTALCTRALLEALRSGSLCADHHTEVQAAARRGLAFLADAFSGGRTGHAEHLRRQGSAGPDAVDRALIVWLMGGVPGDLPQGNLSIAGRGALHGTSHHVNRRTTREIGAPREPARAFDRTGHPDDGPASSKSRARSASVRDRHQRLLFLDGEVQPVSRHPAMKPERIGDDRVETAHGSEAGSGPHEANVVQVLRAATPRSTGTPAQLPFRRGRVGGQHRGASVRAFPAALHPGTRSSLRSPLGQVSVTTSGQPWSC